jgi:acyl dehydratase
MNCVINFHCVKLYVKYYAGTLRPIFWNVTSGNEKTVTKTSCPKRGINTREDQKKVTVKGGDKVSEIRFVSQDDVDNFSKLTGDHNPIHKMQAGTSDSPAIVHGALLNGLVSSVIGTRLPGPGTMVVSQTLHFTNPCYAGEQVTVTVEISSVRKIIACRFECSVNRQNKVTVVLHGEAKLIPMKNFSDQT